MKKYLYIISVFLMLLAYINPIHFNPWSCIQSIFLAGASGLILSLVLLKEKVYIPRFSFFIILVSVIPWVQYFFGKIFYLNTAIIVSLIIFLFWLMFVVGLNIERINNKSVMKFLSIIFVLASLCSSIVCLFQWLNISVTEYLMSPLEGNRPYGNLNQPNQLSTLLILGAISIFYLYENLNFNKYISSILSIIFLFSIVLTQSRTAWLVFLFAIIVYLYFYFKVKFKTSVYFILFYFILFIVLVLSLPLINSFFSNYFSIINTTDASIRVSSGYLRLDIWKQMFSAILKQPFTGYGWFQTSVAQFNVIDKVHGIEWTSSSHNFLLDLLVWNGVILGSIIIIFIIYNFIRPLFYIHNISGFFTLLMVMTIGIHAMLEYPIYYTFFNIPLALLLGQFYAYERRVNYQVGGHFFLYPFIFYILFGCVFFSQYDKISSNIATAYLYNAHKLKPKYELVEKTPIFDNFEERAKWIALNPRKKLSDQSIQDIKNIVSLNITEYDLRKFSILLKYNNREDEAKRVLRILYIMYGIDIRYSDLK